MMRDLKAIGATNATQGRARGLMGRERWRRALAALDATRGAGRRPRPATFEVIYGHAWKAAPTRTPEGHAIVQLERRRCDGRRRSRMTPRDLRHRDRHRRRQDACRRGAAARPGRAGRSRGRHEARRAPASTPARHERRRRRAERRRQRRGAAGRRQSRIRVAAAIAPHVAAAREGVAIELATIAAAYARLARGPTRSSSRAPAARWCRSTRATTCSTSPARSALPVLLVVGVRLGCLNHARLSALAIRARGLVLAGWVANRIDPAHAQPRTRASPRSWRRCRRRSSPTFPGLPACRRRIAVRRCSQRSGGPGRDGPAETAPAQKSSALATT